MKPEIAGKMSCRSAQQRTDNAEMIKRYRDITLLLRTWNDISRLQDKATSYFKQPPTELRLHMESDLLVEQFVVTVLDLIMDAKEQPVKTHESFAHTNYSSRNRIENRILLERTMEISERLKLSDGRDHKQICQAAVKRRHF